MDLQKDYTSKTLQLKPDYEGEVKAVLISSNFNTGARKSVLYVHGYIDYFFHPHLGEKCNENGYDFYAIDLRKYGRALLSHQHPNYCRSIDEYFEEISIALIEIKRKSSEVYLLGHSTGGLTTSSYMNSGSERHLVSGLILNSPFLDFNQSKLEKVVSYYAASLASALNVYSKINGGISEAYAQSIHKDFYGEWDFNLEWKPIKGFPTYFKWVVAIAKAQKALQNADIKVPILVLHSTRSAKIATYSEHATRKDIVLNVEDIKRESKSLGEDITLVNVDDAQHDVFLSPKAVREEAFEKMFDWLGSKF